MKIITQMTLAILLTASCGAQNLLTNGAFSQGNTGFSSGYSYVASGEAASPGAYGVRTNSQSFNGAYNLFYDHTTGQGNMLLLDGAPGITTTVWTEMVSVMTNTQYSYSCWATASDLFNVPTLRFFINGAQVGADMTLSTNSGQWQQFVAVWNSGATNMATLSVVDENPNGYDYGNDFALDDFSFSFAPLLSIALSDDNNVVVSWPSPSTGFLLQQNAGFIATNWTNSSLSVNDNGTTKSVTNSVLAEHLFFRLMHP
ncbi:MAG: hypothetical protein ACREIC_05595 [Limisphaerales bacterium]